MDIARIPRMDIIINTSRDRAKSTFSKKSESVFITGILILVGLKPVIDSTWAYHFEFFNHLLNFQSITALSLISVAILVALFKLFYFVKLESRNAAGIFLGIAFFLLINGLTKWFQIGHILKYVSSYSCLYLFFEFMTAYRAQISLRNQAIKFFFIACIFSILFVFSAGLLQMLGFLPWQYLDYDLGGTFGRLTAFYRHPLDYLRVIIWVYVVFVYIFISLKHRIPILLLILFMFLNFIILRTTHRTTLLLCLLLPFAFSILQLSRERIKKAILCVLITVAGWLLWNTLPDAWIPYNLGVSTRIDFNPSFFSSVYNRNTIHFDDNEIGKLVARKVTIQDILRSRVFYDDSIRKKQLEWQRKRRMGENLSDHQFEIDDPLIPVEMGRGRSVIWMRHLNLFRTLSISAYLFGAPNSFLNDPRIISGSHNQILDLLEYFGVVGILINIIVLLLFLAYLPICTPIKVIIFLTLFWYSITSEPLASPTMIWWCCATMLFLEALKWKGLNSRLYPSAQ